MVRNARELALSIVGGTAGAAVGVLVFYWLKRRGFYALVLPGAFLGLGLYALSRTRSAPRGIVAAVLAIAIGLVIEWWFFPFVADPSFVGFLQRIPELNGVTLLMIGLGAAFAYWWGRDARLSPVGRTYAS